MGIRYQNTEIVKRSIIQEKVRYKNSKKKFAFDVGWVLAGSIVILLLHFLQNPILARYLGPEGIGLFSMVTMIAGIIMLIAQLGTNSAVVKYAAEYKDDKSKLHAMFSSAFILMVIFGVAASIVLFVLSDKFASMFNMPSLSPLLKIYAFVIPFSLTFEVIMGLFNGLREMKHYSFFNILNSIMVFLFIVSFLFLGFGIKGAVIGNMLALIMVMVIAAVIMKKFMHFRISNYKENIKKLTSFSSPLMLINVIQSVNYQIDSLLIAYFLTATDVGYYAVAVSLSRIFWRIPQSIQMITYPATSEYWAKDEIQSLNKMIDKSMKYSAYLLLTVGLGIWFFAKEIIVFLFGQSFVSSVFPFQILIIGTVIFGIFKSISSTLPGIGRPDLSLKISIAGFIIFVVLNILFIPHFGIAGAAVASIISSIIIATLSIYFIVKLTKVDIDAKWYASAFVITLLAMAVFSACSAWRAPYFLASLILSIYITIFFVLFLTKEDKEIFKKLIRSIVFRESK